MDGCLYLATYRHYEIDPKIMNFKVSVRGTPASTQLIVNVQTVGFANLSAEMRAEKSPNGIVVHLPSGDASAPNVEALAAIIATHYLGRIGDEYDLCEWNGTSIWSGR